VNWLLNVPGTIPKTLEYPTYIKILKGFIPKEWFFQKEVLNSFIDYTQTTCDLHKDYQLNEPITDLQNKILQIHITSNKKYNVEIFISFTSTLIIINEFNDDMVPVNKTTIQSNPNGVSILQNVVLNIKVHKVYKFYNDFIYKIIIDAKIIKGFTFFHENINLNLKKFAESNLDLNPIFFKIIESVQTTTPFVRNITWYITSFTYTITYENISYKKILDHVEVKFNDTEYFKCYKVENYNLYIYDTNHISKENYIIYCLIYMKEKYDFNVTQMTWFIKQMITYPKYIR
jgi:hypothetical protein